MDQSINQSIRMDRSIRTHTTTRTKHRLDREPNETATTIHVSVLFSPQQPLSRIANQQQKEDLQYGWIDQSMEEGGEMEE